MGTLSWPGFSPSSPLPPYGQTDTCENITFPHTSDAGSNDDSLLKLMSLSFAPIRHMFSTQLHWFPVIISEKTRVNSARRYRISEHKEDFSAKK